MTTRAVTVMNMFTTTRHRPIQDLSLDYVYAKISQITLTRCQVVSIHVLTTDNCFSKQAQYRPDYGRLNPFKMTD